MPAPIALVRGVLSLMAGALLPLGFSPFNLWPVPMVATALVFLLVRNAPIKTSTLCGFLFGIGMFGTGTSWIYVSIHEFGAASVPLAGFLTLLFVLAISALMIMPLFFLYSGFNRSFQSNYARPPWQQAFLFAGLWVLFEWVRSWLFTGFPWLLLGYALLDTPFSSLAPVTGTYGLSLLMVTTSCLLVALFIPGKASRGKNRAINLLALLVFFGLWGLTEPLQKVQWTEKTGKLEFSAVQGNIPQLLKWDPDFIQSTINTYTSLTLEQWDKDLIIWPENAIPLLYNRARGLMEQLDREARQQGSTLILGIPYDDNSTDRTRFYNSVLSLGQGEGRYDKQKLVPFGEYVPFESMLRGLIDFFNLPMSEFSRGKGSQPHLKVGETLITPYICYEVVYPDFAASTAKGSGLLITISNDTWFGKSIGPLQHFQMARMRSLETGRYMIRATNDGISALIDNKGKVLATIPRFRKGVLSETAEVRSGNTPYMITGSWPTLVVSLLMILLALTCPLRKKRFFS